VYRPNTNPNPSVITVTTESPTTPPTVNGPPITVGGVGGDFSQTAS